MKLNVKRLLALVLALMLAFSLTACGQTAPADSTSEAEQEPAAEGSEETEALDLPTVDYTKYFDENGYWVGVNASELVKLAEDYNSITIPADALVVTEEELNSAISNILSSFPVETQITDRAVEDGDQVNIDYVGSVDGVEFDGGSTSGNGTVVTAGSTQYIDDFLTQIIGHKPGETFDVNVTFPEDYGVEDLNGKDAVFVTTINYITETTDPVLDDAFVKENLKGTYEVDTVAELKAYLTEQLAGDKRLDYVYSYIIDNSELLGEVPQQMMDYQKDDMLNYYAQYATMYGMSLEDFISNAMGLESVDDLIDEQTMESMKNYAKQYLVYQAIAETEGLKIDDAALKAYMLEATGGEDYSTYEAQFGKNYLVWNALSYSAFHAAADKAVTE